MSTSAVSGVKGASSSSGGGNTIVDKFIKTALQYNGLPYLWGGGHGGIASGTERVDCSGLVTQAAGRNGVNLQGTAADLQSQCSSEPVNPANLKPGDLLFVGNPAEHVGIYLGNGMCIQAPHTGANVYIGPIGNEWTSAGRPHVFEGINGTPPAVSASSENGPGGTAQVSDGGGSSGGGGSGNFNNVFSYGGGTGSPSSIALPFSNATGAVGGNGDSSGGSGGGGAANAASAAQGPVGPMPSGDVAQWIQQAIQILEQMGVPADKINAQDINTIIQHESGGNPHAINLTDSNAAAGHPSKGLMQTIDSTFSSYAAPGHNDIYNPVDNIVAGVRYALSRYGSLSNVPGIKSIAAGGSYVGY